MSAKIDYAVFQSMAMALLEEILLNVDKPNEFPTAATQRLMELTGAKTAVMVECLQLENQCSHRIMVTVPKRRSALAEQEEIYTLIDLLHQAGDFEIWNPDLDGPHAEPLKKLGFGLSLAVPLRAGSWRAGGLLLFDLPELGRVRHVFDIFKAISQVIALSLRSSLLFEEQGAILEARSKTLQVHRQFLQALFDNKLVAMVRLDADGNYTEVNHQWEEMTGYDRAELLTMNFRDLTHPEDIKVSTLLQQFSHSRKENALQITKRYVHKNGSSFWANISATGLYDDHENFTGLIGIINDVTEAKQAEQKRQELEDQLRQTYKMEAIGTMAGGIAHNFNNSLSVILGNIELSHLKEKDPEIMTLLKNAKTAVLRARDLVSQIMTYSHKGNSSKAPLQMPLIIDETIKLLTSTIPSTVKIDQDICQECYQTTINADASQIQEVLFNLCNNAVQAMAEKGELDIALDVVPLSAADIPETETCKPGRYVRLRVQDNGCGMPPELIDKIFDPFFTTKELHEGTGMGLATVQGIMKQHGGMIQVNSTVDHGSRFDLYFPELQERATTQKTEAPVQYNLPGGKEQILFVDDDEMLAELGKQMLGSMGYKVAVMNDSQEALKLFTANADHIDMVITDQTMPNLCGKDFIAEIKKVRPDIPTILCTGFSSKIDRDKAENLGIDAFLMKPLDMPTLLQTVRRVLDRDKEI